MENKDVVRTAKLKVHLRKSDMTFFDQSYRAVILRANLYCRVLLAMRGKDVRVRSGRKYESLTAEYFSAERRHLFPNATPHHDADLEIVYDGIIAAKHTRGYMTAFSTSKSEVGKRTRARNGIPNPMEPAKAVCRKLLDAGVMPSAMVGDFNRDFDFAAWEMATSHMRSWDDRTKAAQANYTKEAALRDESRPPAHLEAIWAAWSAEGHIFSERLGQRFAKYGFDVRGYEDEMAAAQSLSPREEDWAVIFAWQTAESKVGRLRADASFCFPDIDLSPRSMAFGDMYASFTLEWSDDAIVVDVGGHKLAAMPTGYFRDLSVTRHAKDNGYVFSYRRGNNSDLDESVTATLKQVSLFRGHGGDYFLMLPLNIATPPLDDVSEAAMAFYRKGDDGEAAPQGVRCLGVDLNISPLLAMSVGEADSNDHSGFRVIRSIKDGGYLDLRFKAEVDGFRKRAQGLGDAVRLLAFLENPKVPHQRAEKNIGRMVGRVAAALDIPADRLGKMTAPDLRLVILAEYRQMNAKYRQMKRYDLYPSRQTGLSGEMLTWAALVREWISVRKRWTYYGKPPAGAFEKRPGFEHESDYYASLKRDIVKKIGQRVVYHARAFGAKIIVMESLKFKPMLANDKGQNLLLALWSPAQIKEAVEHFASQYGVRVVEVDARHTSQVDADTGDYGYRDETDKCKLWVVRGGKVYAKDADLNASENLLQRFFTRHGRMVAARAKPLENHDDFGLPAGTFVFEAAKRSAKDGAMWDTWDSRGVRVAFGTAGFAVRPDGGAIPLRTADLKKAKKTDRPKAARTFYRHGDRWLGYRDHLLKVEEIKHLAERDRRECGSIVGA